MILPQTTLSNLARPFVKWAGGKTRLLAEIQARTPATFGAYFEPFLGGGAVFFDLARRTHVQATLADANPELINTYCAVRDHVAEVIAALRFHQARHCAAHYYAVRSQIPRVLPLVDQAARLIYLNKTCYNGLYRVNGQGQFNVALGSYANPSIVDEFGLRAAARALADSLIVCSDFEEVVVGAQAGDWVYFDPPYFSSSRRAFTGYRPEGFERSAQQRLSEVCRHLDRRGVMWLVSNSDHAVVRDLYYGFKVETVQCNRAINSRPDRRGRVGELLIRNY